MVDFYFEYFVFCSFFAFLLYAADVMRCWHTYKLFLTYTEFCICTLDILTHTIDDLKKKNLFIIFLCDIINLGNTVVTCLDNFNIRFLYYTTYG